MCYILQILRSAVTEKCLLLRASDNGNIVDCQLRFQLNKSTVDCIFIIHAIFSKILNGCEKLYCCFVDHQKAFDLINRELLWHKLVRDGCTSTMIKALHAM